MRHIEMVFKCCYQLCKAVPGEEWPFHLTLNPLHTHLGVLTASICTQAADPYQQALTQLRSEHPAQSGATSASSSAPLSNGTLTTVQSSQTLPKNMEAPAAQNTRPQAQQASPQRFSQASSLPVAGTAASPQVPAQPVGRGSTAEGPATVHEAASARDSSGQSSTTQPPQQPQPAFGGRSMQQDASGQGSMQQPADGQAPGTSNSGGQASTQQPAPEFAARADTDAAPDRHNLAESISAALTAQQEVLHRQGNGITNPGAGSQSNAEQRMAAPTHHGSAFADGHANGDQGSSADQRNVAGESGGDTSSQAQLSTARNDEANPNPDSNAPAANRAPVKFGRALPGMTPFANASDNSGNASGAGERRPSLASRQLPSVLAAQARQRALEEARSSQGTTSARQTNGHEESFQTSALDGSGPNSSDQSSPGVASGLHSAQQRQSGPHLTSAPGNVEMQNSTSESAEQRPSDQSSMPGADGRENFAQNRRDGPGSQQGFSERRASQQSSTTGADGRENGPQNGSEVSGTQQLASRASQAATEQSRQPDISIPAGAPLPTVSLADGKVTTNAFVDRPEQPSFASPRQQEKRVIESSRFSQAGPQMAGNGPFNEKSAQLDHAQVNGFPAGSLSGAGVSSPAVQQDPPEKMSLAELHSESPSLSSKQDVNQVASSVEDSSVSIKARHPEQAPSPSQISQQAPSPSQTQFPTASHPTPIPPAGLQLPPSDGPHKSSQSPYSHAQTFVGSAHHQNGTQNGDADTIKAPRTPVISPGSQFSEAQRALRSGSMDGAPAQDRAPPSRNVILAKAASINGSGLSPANGNAAEAPRRQISKINIAAIWNAPPGSDATKVF